MRSAKTLFHFAFALTLLVSLVKSNDSVDNIKSYPLQHLTKTAVNGRIRYALGARINGDSLVAHSVKNQTWSTQQNVTVTLTYPSSGIGKQVTYIVIEFDQTSNSAEAYVSKGGLHERFISVVIAAYNTLLLNYDAEFYGI